MRPLALAVIMAVWLSTGTALPASSWWPQTRVNYVYVPGTTLAGAPDIAVSPVNGRVYVVGQAQWNDYNGNTWSPIEQVFSATTENNNDMQGAAVAADSSGMVYAAAQTPPGYGSTGPTYLVLSTKLPGGNWSAPGIVENSDPCANPYLVADKLARMDGDNDVDQDDFLVFEACVSGANVPANPDCAG